MSYRVEIVKRELTHDIFSQCKGVHLEITVHFYDHNIIVGNTVQC